MHLICINCNNIINKWFSANFFCVVILFTCVLTSMQNFAAIPEGGGQIDPPPPSKNLLSKSPVKIGLRRKHYVTHWKHNNERMSLAFNIKRLYPPLLISVRKDKSHVATNDYLILLSSIVQSP